MDGEVCFNTWKQFSRINRELCYTLCIIEHDTVQTFVLWSQTNRVMGSARSRVGIENFNGKQDRYIFIRTYIRSSPTLSPRCLLFLPRVMAIKIIKCLYTREYAQLSRNFTSRFPFFPSLFLLAYLVIAQIEFFSQSLDRMNQVSSMFRY